MYTYSCKFTAGNLSGSYLALEDVKPIPQNSLHFPEAQYFHSLLSWLLLSSSTAKTSLHLTLCWTNAISWMKAALKINPFYCHLGLLAHILILLCDFLAEIANTLSSHGLEIHIFHSWYFKSYICFDARQGIWSMFNKFKLQPSKLHLYGSCTKTSDQNSDILDTESLVQDSNENTHQYSNI